MRGIKVKKYIKPELFYEFYELSQHIADCTWELKNMIDVTVCDVRPDLDKLPFLTDQDRMFAEWPTCTILRDDFEEFCYQTSTLNATLFNS